MFHQVIFVEIFVETLSSALIAFHFDTMVNKPQMISQIVFVFEGDVAIVATASLVFRRLSPTP
jgi:hypothetical protein